MMKPIKTIIIEDESIFRKSLSVYLRNRPEFEMVGDFADGAPALQFLKRRNEVAVAILDLNLPTTDGLEMTREILAINPNISILILSQEGEKSLILQALKNGAHGYVTKDAPIDELLVGIKALAKGNNYFSSNIAAKVMIRYSRNSPGVASTNIKPFITNREQQILEFLYKELTNQEIADKLFISPRTVDTHKRNLRKKLNVKSSVGLIKYYLNHFQQGKIVSSF
ncbi:MAG: response regulator transcription factor [Bacteroidota bacterium]